MTKPLSEQVAELEAERDRLKADAISDLIKRNWLETQVRNREGDLEKFKKQNYEMAVDNRDLRAERDDLQRQVQEARDEVDALRDLVDVLGKHVTIPSEHIRFKGMPDLRYKEPTKPEQPTYAPDVPDLHVRWRGERATGYADDDHQDAEVTQWHQPTPRLTVHDLEVAPIGSVLKHRSFYFVKRKGGDWSIPEFMDSSDPKETAEHLIKMGWADATLTAPEAQ